MQKKKYLFGVQIESIQDLFWVIDRDGTGTIEADELKEGLNCLGEILSSVDIMYIIHIMDKNNTGATTHNTTTDTRHRTICVCIRMLYGRV